MIYVIKQNDYVYITQKKRDLDSNKDPGELLLTLNWGPDEKSDIAILEEQLRPYIDLENSLLTKRFKFSETVLEIIKSHPKRLPKYTYAYKKDAEKLIQEVNTCINKLKKFELLEDYVTIDLSVEEILEKAVYTCDLHNIISTCLGKDYSIIKDFLNLTDNEQAFIADFYSKSSKQEKINFLRDIVAFDVDKILPFIPQWYRITLRVFGFEHAKNTPDKFKFAIFPEFKDLERLDENSAVLENQDFFIKKEVYQIFHLDEIWKGKDIKAKFTEIYEKLGTTRNGRVHDIFNYFETAITRNGYRLISRKII